MRLDYYVPTRDESTERVVDPLRVVDADGHTYLDGLVPPAPRTSGCSGSTGSPRAEVLDTPVEEHADLEPRDLADGIFQPSTDDLLVTLRLEPQRPLGGGVLPGRGDRARPAAAG